VKGPTPTNLDEARRLLSDCVLFRKLAPKEREALVARAHMRSFEAGNTIFLMGALHDSMFAVLSGEVRISMPSAEGKEVVLAIVHAREVFGEIAMLDGKPRSADATALTACNLAVLDRRDVLGTLDRNPGSWLGLVELALLGLPERLAKTLLRALDTPRDHPSNPTDLRLSQYELANRVGAARESVNKCLHEWQRAGIIRMEKRVIKIVDRAALEKLAEPE